MVQFVLLIFYVLLTEIAKNYPKQNSIKLNQAHALPLVNFKQQQKPTEIRVVNLQMVLHWPDGSRVSLCKSNVSESECLAAQAQIISIVTVKWTTRGSAINFKFSQSFLKIKFFARKWTGLANSNIQIGITFVASMLIRVCFSYCRGIYLGNPNFRFVSVWAGPIPYLTQSFALKGFS